MIVTAKELAVLRDASRKMHIEYRGAVESHCPGDFVAPGECWAEVELFDGLIEEASVAPRRVWEHP